MKVAGSIQFIVSMLVASVTTLFVVPVTEAALTTPTTSTKNLRSDFSGGADRRHRGKSDEDHGDDNDSNEPGEESYYLKALLTIEHVKPPIPGTDSWDRDLLIPVALVHADNKINTGSKYHAQSAFVEKYVDIPEDGNFCPEEEEDGDGDENNKKVSQSRGHFYDLHWTFIDYTCGMFCGLDDDYILEGKQDYLNPMGLFLEVSNGRTPKNHRALEAEICRELRESGEPALADIAKCKLEYLFDNDEDTMRLGPFQAEK